MGDKKDAKQAAKAAKADKAARKLLAASADPTLPKTRAALMELHRETRARRNAAAHGSPEHVEAITLIARIEVEIARIERAADPPLG
jgi:hypothetical protein